MGWHWNLPSDLSTLDHQTLQLDPSSLLSMVFFKVLTQQEESLAEMSQNVASVSRPLTLLQ